MTRTNEHPFESERFPPDQRQRLVETIEQRGGNPSIPERYMDAMVMALDTGYLRYGDPSKPSYQEFHNDIHFFNVAVGSWRVLDFMRDDLKLNVQDSDYIVGGLVGSLHDIVHEATKNGVLVAGDYPVDFGHFTITVHNDGTKTDEVLSAEVAVLYLEKLGIPKKIQQRVSDGILLTEVSFETGTPVQKGAGQGGRDYGAIAAAIADTEGIFGGEERLSKDVARLIAEMLDGKVSDEGLVMTHINKFIESEAPFVRQKIAEFVLHILGTEDDPDKKRDLSDALARQFAPYERKALAAAAFFDSRISDIQQRRDQIHAYIHDLQRQINPTSPKGEQTEK